MDRRGPEADLHVRDYADILWRRRDIAILFFVATVLAVTVGSFIMKPVYRATVTILVDPESPNVLTTTGAVELQSQNYYSYREYYQSQTELLTSYTLARKVFDEFGLGKDPAYAGAREPVKKFLKTVRVDPVRDTRLLKLSVDNGDPALAAKVANRIAELYVLRNLYYISKNELMNLLKNEYLKLEAKMSEYEKVFKAGHPEMVKLKKEMAELTRRIELEKTSVCGFDNIEQYIGQGAQHALAGFKANNITIQDAAEKPVSPIRPRKMLNILLSVVFGAFGAVTLAFFFEYLDDSAKTVEDIERVTGWPFLGSVPDIDKQGALKEAEKDVFVHVKPKDPVSELYRIIRTRMLFTPAGDRPVRCVLVTSPGPREGKTVTACNLAITLAQNGRKVLLVDGDMRMPRLHEAFGGENRAGLSAYLSAQAPIDGVVQKTGIENVWLVSGGVVPPNPSELLAGHRLGEFVETASAKFDFVLFDSPPVGMLTDAAIIAGRTDGVIVVVENGRTSKRMLARIDQLLDHVKAHIIGIVFNKAAAGPGSYYYYSYYYGGKRKG